MPTVATQLQPAYTPEVDQTQQASLAPAPSSQSSAQNSSGDFVPAPQPHPANSSPTDGAREATTPPKPTAAEIERMTDERVAADPKFQEAEKRFRELQAAEADFRLVDGATFLGRNDNIITLTELKDVAADASQPQEVREAASRLLNNVALWNDLATNLGDGVNDNRVGAGDVSRLKNAAKIQMDELRDAVKAEVKADVAATNSAADGAQNEGPTSSTGPTGPLFTASAPSSKGGMEGAVENANNAIQNIGDSMNSIMAEMSDPNTTPKRRKELQNQYNDLQQLQSMLIAMYKQMQEAISNITKMYSDVASNSIRNMR